MRFLRSAIFAALCVFPAGAALAQAPSAYPSGPGPMPPGAAGLLGIGSGLSNQGGNLGIATGGVTNAMVANPSLTLGSTPLTLGGTVTSVAGLVNLTMSGTLAGTPTITGLQSVNGWAPSWALQMGANAATIAAGGSGYANGQVVPLSGGTCPTQPSVVVYANSGGAITHFAVDNPGSCSTVPADPVVASSGGATFNFANYWRPIDPGAPAFDSSGANGQLFYPPNLAQGVLNPPLGPNCFGNSGSCGGGANNADGMGGGTGMTGVENVFSGFNVGAQVTTGFWLTGLGWHAFGHETIGGRSIAMGTDAAKWTTNSQDSAYLGANSGKFLLNPQNVVAIGSGSALGGQIIAAITGAVNNGSGVCRITTSTTNMATGDTAVTTGIAGTGGIATACNGVWTNVTVVDATHLDLTGSAFAGTYVSGGNVDDYGAVAWGNSVIIGKDALNVPNNAMRSQGRLVGIGDGVFAALTTGVDNNAIGHQSAAALTTGKQNDCYGSTACATLTTGAGNFIGGYKSDVLSSGTSNAVAIGGNNNGGQLGARADNQSTVVGAIAGNANMAGSGNMDIFGYKIANTNCRTPNNDIFIGTNGNIDCFSTSSNETHTIVIGTVASMTPTGSSTINIENIWKATGTGTPSTSVSTFSGNLVSAAYGSTSVATTLTAAGTTQATALALTSQINTVTTAAASTGVALPAASTVGVGGYVIVFNAGANPIKVYGVNGGSDTIDGVAGATGVTLTNAKRCIYYVTAANTWISAQLGVVSAFLTNRDLGAPANDNHPVGIAYAA